MRENSAAGFCGSHSPRPTLVLDAKPVEKHGSEVNVQVSGDVRFGGDPVQEFARS